jgi:hypothetical protein
MPGVVPNYDFSRRKNHNLEPRPALDKRAASSIGRVNSVKSAPTRLVPIGARFCPP